MINVFIANNLVQYRLGKSDGLIFKNVTKSDVEELRKFANRYNKQIDVVELKDVESFKEDTDNIIEDKRKIKKIFITNGKETIKITPDKLPEYMSKGYHPGRK